MRRLCHHEAATESAHGGVGVSVCAECQEVRFTDRRGPISPSSALARLFGEFDLVGAMPAVGAPGREVLMYRAPSRLLAASLRVVEPNRWIQVDEHLWMCHDGHHLLFSHDDPTVSHLVGA